MSNKLSFLLAIISIGVLNLIEAVPSHGGVPRGSKGSLVTSDLLYKTGELLVRFAPKLDGKHRTLEECNSLLSSIGGGRVKHLHRRVPGSALIELPETITVEQALTVFNKADGILYAAPNHIGMVAATFPNDTRFNELWGMHNTSQTGGTEDAYIDAPQARGKERTTKS